MDDNLEVISLGTTDSESWPTRISRTRISSVEGLSLGHSPNTVQSLEDILRTVQQVGLKRYPFDAIEVQDRVGEGESFCVDRCLYNKKIVAVKHIKLESLETDSHAFNRRLRTVLNEIRIMHHTPLRDHPNTLSVLGYGWRTIGRNPLPYIVVEYGICGSLRKYLSETPRELNAKIIMAGDVASGITALHQCDIIHGDLKLDNIVVMRSWDRPPGIIAKICDFGQSIILADDKKHLKYYGTSLYNAPEVENQEKYPLSAENLIKCDMWAFALTLWEILDGGGTFFKKSWRNHPSYAKSLTPISVGTEQGYVLINEATTEESTAVPIDSSQHIFGSFDFNHLCTLSKDFINSVNFKSAFADKSCLRLFLYRALQVDPQLRPSKIQLGPEMSRWNPSDINTLHARLATHTGTSQWTFDFLAPDQDKEILWNHQRQIFDDFEKIATLLKPSTESAAAAFQVALCYIVGFGTSKSLPSAAKFLRVAKELNHDAAKLFDPQLQNVVSSDPFPSYSSYSSQIVRGLQLHPPSEPIILKFTSDIEALKDQETSQKFPQKRLASYTPIDAPLKYPTPQLTFQTYEELKQWLSSSSVYYHQLETTVLISHSLKMSILECALLFRDLETVRLLLERHPKVLNFRHLPDPLLVTACRTTEIQLVKTLLQSGVDPFAGEGDKGTLFHWLFMLGENLRSLVPSLLKAVGARQNLDIPCAATKIINPQWPLRLTGTPLAFAVSVGSIVAVETLLHLGANPAASIHGDNVAFESEDRSTDWTPVHLAIKYHSIPILSLLIAGVEARQPRSLLTSIWKLIDSQPLKAIPEESLKSRISVAFQYLLSFSESPDTWQSSIGRILSFSSPVERIAWYGNNHQVRIEQLIALLPKFCLVLPSKKGVVALMQAIDFHDVDVVKALLNAHPGLARAPFRDPRDHHFVYPMHFAAQIASHRDSDDALDIVKILMRLNPEHIMIRDSQRRTPLHFAVTGISDRVAKWLIENGALIYATTNEDSNRQMPLHVIRMASSMNLLLDAGANINQQNNLGCTLAHIAALAGKEHLLEAIINRKKRLDIKDNLGRTILHCAVIKQSVPIVTMLLKAGLDINAKTHDGNTPLHLAAQSFRSDLLRLLVKHEADISARNSENSTPLHQCVLTGDEICLRPLLDIIMSKNPSLINATDVRLQTPLHVAAIFARSSVASELLSYGADPILVDTYGNTPLHAVINASDENIKRSQGDKVEFCGVMCKHVPELLTTDKFGLTPWREAYEKNQLDLVEIIFQYGGLKACTRFVHEGEYVGNLLVDNAIKTDKWDFVMRLLNDKETLTYFVNWKGDQFPGWRIDYWRSEIDVLKIAIRMSDKMSMKLVLQDLYNIRSNSCPYDDMEAKNGYNPRIWRYRRISSDGSIEGHETY